MIWNSVFVLQSSTELFSYLRWKSGGERRTPTFIKYQSYGFIVKSNIYTFKFFYRRNQQAENNVQIKGKYSVSVFLMFFFCLGFFDMKLKLVATLFFNE